MSHEKVCSTRRCAKLVVRTIHGRGEQPAKQELRPRSRMHDTRDHVGVAWLDIWPDAGVFEALALNGRT